MEEKRYQTDEIICQEGELGVYFYIVDQGELESLKK